MTKRRRPAPDDAVKGPDVAADSAPRQRWPSAPQSEQAEVALFTVRGPATPGASVIDVNAAETVPSLPLIADVDDDPFAERPLDAFPSESAVGRGHAIDGAFDAVPSLDAFPLERRDDVPSGSPTSALPLPGNTEGRLTSSIAALAALASLASRTGTAARRSGRGWLVAASIVLAVGVAGLVLSRLADGPPAADDAALSVRTLDILASLAPGIGNRTAVVEPAAPSDLDGPVARNMPRSSTPVVTATAGQTSRLERPATSQRSAPPALAPVLSPRATTAGPARDSTAGTAGASRESAVGPLGPPRDRAVLAAAGPPPLAVPDAPANTGTTPSATAPPATSPMVRSGDSCASIVAFPQADCQHRAICLRHTPDGEVPPVPQPVTSSTCHSGFQSPSRQWCAPPCQTG